MGEYKKYQHIEKLASDEVKNILIGKCYIFPKIDGTNAHLWKDGGTIRFGSRRKEVTQDEDNQGFAKWCTANYGIINALFDVLPDGAHVYGEWLVPHSIKTYKEDAWRQLYIFDIVVDDRHIQYEELSDILDGVGWKNYIPPIRIITNPRKEDIEKCILENHFLMPNTDCVGEGVVVKNYDFVNKFGRQVWAKVVTADFKTMHAKAMGPPESRGKTSTEQRFVDDFLTEDIMDKAFASIKAEMGGWKSQYVPRLIGTVWHDLVRECTWDAVKKYKNPTLDFKRLQGFCCAKLRAHFTEVF